MAVPFILEILMKISSTRMEKNLYNKVDAKKWMVIPKLSEIHATTYFDAGNLVFFDLVILHGAVVAEDNLDFSKMFEEL